MTADRVSGRCTSPRIIIVGGGFGGLEVAKALGHAGVGATLVDRSNHHLFQPLLYQVATAALAAPDIAEPLRKVLRRQPSVRVLYGEVESIDTTARAVLMGDGRWLPYEILVLAPGSQSAFFGHDDWKEFTHGLKTIGDAERMRSELLWAFEQAEWESDRAEQERLMTFVVIGGGPTGVEMAGSIAELSRFTLTRDFRNIQPERTRILLVEAGPRLLAGFDVSLADFARQRLERLGVEIRLGQSVEDIGARHVTVAGERLAVGLTVWAAGVAGSPLARHLGVDLERGSRVRVGETLEVVGRPGVFAIGDIAYLPGTDGKPLPGLAQVARQQGIHLGRGLARMVRTGRPLAPFVYRSRGNTAIVGRHAAVFEVAGHRLKGSLAWLAWAIVHVYLLVGFQNRVRVSLQWLWRYLTYERGARLITREHHGAASSDGLAAMEPNAVRNATSGVPPAPLRADHAGARGSK